MVFAMAVIGAITRLTESGLSITEWQPVTGILPPLNEAEWMAEFELYKQTPEFQHKHFWMELDDFKNIYFWEWLHRLWGRLIGIVYAVPLIWFWVRKQIPQGYGWKLTGLLALGGLQGFVGWFMVMSGLVDQPHVSHYRLALHLGIAFIIFGLLLWVGLDLWHKDRLRAAPAPSKPHLMAHGLAGLGLLSLTIIWGAFVAGLNAGLIYNSFPLMNGHFFPPEPFMGVSAPFEQHAWVQFIHRWLAIFSAFVLLAYAWRARATALGIMVVIQAGLGILTLLTHVHLHVATAHQAGALILLTLLIVSLHKLRYPRAPSSGV